MLNKGQFKELIEKKQRRDKYVRKLLYELGIDITAGDTHDDFAEYAFDLILSQCFNEEGVDMVYWWMYEDVDKYLYKEGSNGKEICNDLTSIDSLYDWLVENCLNEPPKTEPESETAINEKNMAEPWTDCMGATLAEGDDVLIAIEGRLRTGIVEDISETELKISYNKWENGKEATGCMCFSTETSLYTCERMFVLTKDLNYVVKHSI